MKRKWQKLIEQKYLKEHKQTKVDLLKKLLTLITGGLVK